jgi:hypothetical protein
MAQPLEVFETPEGLMRKGEGWERRGVGAEGAWERMSRFNLVGAEGAIAS